MPSLTINNMHDMWLNDGCTWRRLDSTEYPTITMGDIIYKLSESISINLDIDCVLNNFDQIENNFRISSSEEKEETKIKILELMKKLNRLMINGE